MRKRWLNQIPPAVVALILFVALTHLFIFKTKLAKVVARTTFPNLSPTRNKEDSTQDLFDKKTDTTKTILARDGVIVNTGRLKYGENVLKLTNKKSEEPLKYKELIDLNFKNSKTNNVKGIGKIRFKIKNISSDTIQFNSPNSRSITLINSPQYNPAIFKGSRHLQIREKAIFRLTRELNSKILKSLPTDELPSPQTCSNNSCDKVTGCKRQELPSSILQRIEQLIAPLELRLDTEYSNCIREMGYRVGGFYDTIVLTGTSSDQFEESKQLISSFRANFMPHFRNFTLVFYNIGLSTQQKKIISRMLCDECLLLDFPFQKFPDHISNLKCPSWKPIIIKSLISHCKVLLWMDPTTHFLPNVWLLKELFRRVIVRGFQGGTGEQLIPCVTPREMFHFFGDEACVYLPYTNSLSTFTLFVNENLIRSAVIEPWTACALNASCMCLEKYIFPKISQAGCSKTSRTYDCDKCYSFDQSALSIIIRKLFQTKSHHLFIKNVTDFFGVNSS